MTEVRLALLAMKTRFELVLQGEDEVRLRAAGEEALGEIERIEAQLSFYRPSSEIGRINAAAAERPVRVDPRVFHLLRRAQQLTEATGGAFDPTIGPLMRAWGFVGGSGHLPDEEALRLARERTGMHLVHLDESSHAVRFARPGVQIDLGAIGKGYAIEEAALILRELGIESAFLHGGTSTVRTIGSPLDADGWRVAVTSSGLNGSGAGDAPLAVVALADEALSVSAVWGKSFEVEGREYGHVLDPRVGRPVEGAVLAALVTASATDSDALSTAALVLGAEAGRLAAHEGVTGGLVLMPDGEPILFGRLPEA